MPLSRKFCTSDSLKAMPVSDVNTTPEDISADLQHLKSSLMDLSEKVGQNDRPSRTPVNAHPGSQLSQSRTCLRLRTLSAYKITLAKRPQSLTQDLLFFTLYRRKSIQKPIAQHHQCHRRPRSRCIQLQALSCIQFQSLLANNHRISLEALRVPLKSPILSSGTSTR